MQPAEIQTTALKRLPDWTWKRVGPGLRHSVKMTVSSRTDGIQFKAVWTFSVLEISVEGDQIFTAGTLQGSTKRWF